MPIFLPSLLLISDSCLFKEVVWDERSSEIERCPKISSAVGDPVPTQMRWRRMWSDPRVKVQEDHRGTMLKASASKDPRLSKSAEREPCSSNHAESKYNRRWHRVTTKERSVDSRSTQLFDGVNWTSEVDFWLHEHFNSHDPWSCVKECLYGEKPKQHKCRRMLFWPKEVAVS